MALKAVVEKVDDLAESIRPLYQEKEGRFVLDVEPIDGFALEDVAGLKSTLGKELTKRKQLEKDFAKFKDLDPDKAREAIVKLEELGNIDPLKEADKIVDQRLKAATGQLVEKHTKELDQERARSTRLQKAFESTLIDQAATAALAEAKGSVELLLPHVQRHTRVRELDDGRHVVEVIDKDGTVRIGNSKGDPMTITDLVQEMKKSEAFGRAFDGSGQSGSGMRPSGSNGAGNPAITKRSDLKTEPQRAAFIDANGLEAYQALPM
jgi:DNA-directed RNA polymerase subunit F